MMFYWTKAGGYLLFSVWGTGPTLIPHTLTLLGLLLLFGLGFGHELQVFTIALGLHAVARDEPQ